MPEERLQKVLARAGFGSRRACEQLIAAGRVRVNGEVARLGGRADPARDTVEVDGVKVSLAEDTVYYALHKPAGVLTTARDPQGRPTVLDLVPARPRVFAVGRLDRDTSGLLLLTNDGGLANRVAHPRYRIPKTYVAEVAGCPSPATLRRLVRGIELEDGPARADRLRVLSSAGGRALLEIVVTEGRNRLVRRMLQSVGHPVRSLTRVAIGPIRLGRLRPGQWRKLSRTEVLALMAGGEQGSGRTTGPPPCPAAGPGASAPGGAGAFGPAGGGASGPARWGASGAPGASKPS